MSGQPNDDQTDGEQGSQSTGGQHQGGQHGGAQPQGGQPQEAQPQGAQPQGGQPTGAQPQGAPRQYQQGAPTGGEQELIKDWTVFTGILFAISGAAVGLMWFLIDAIDQDLVTADGGGGIGGGIGAAFSSFVLLVFPVVAVSLAAFVGAAIAMRTDHPEQTTFKLTAAGAGVGTVLFFVIAAVLTSLTFENASLAFGGLIVDSIIAGLAAAGAAVGGVWTVRNQLP